mmetsp:Transcript_2509/g.5999  ORF Transcript_2509/g.5999 Transcript_2509/m.5999 type:complete len:307 (+) Transcript_2509:32-952(+)
MDLYSEHKPYFHAPPYLATLVLLQTISLLQPVPFCRLAILPNGKDLGLRKIGGLPFDGKRHSTLLENQHLGRALCRHVRLFPGLLLRVQRRLAGDMRSELCPRIARGRNELEEEGDEVVLGERGKDLCYLVLAGEVVCVRAHLVHVPVAAPLRAPVLLLLLGDERLHVLLKVLLRHLRQVLGKTCEESLNPDLQEGRRVHRLDQEPKRAHAEPELLGARDDVPQLLNSAQLPVHLLVHHLGQELQQRLGTDLARPDLEVCDDTRINSARVRCQLLAKHRHTLRHLGELEGGGVGGRQGGPGEGGCR